MRGVKSNERDALDGLLNAEHAHCALPDDRRIDRPFTQEQHELYQTLLTLGWVAIVPCRSGEPHTHYEVTPAGLEARRLQDLVDKGVEP